MSKSQPLNLKREDYDALVTDYPEVEELLRRLNTFGTGVSGSLGKGLTLGENLAAQVADIVVAPKSDWQTVTYKNAWAAFAGDQDAQFVKLENGLVRCRGRIAGGASGSVAFTLPADYAPDRTIYLSAVTAGVAQAQIQVGTNGDVTVSYLGAPAWISLDSATFIAADRHPEVNDGTTIKVKLSLPTGRRPQGVMVLKARDITSNSTPGHVGNPPWVDWYEGNGELVIEHIAGLAPSHRYDVRLLIWGA